MQMMQAQAQQRNNRQGGRQRSNSDSSSDDGGRGNNVHVQSYTGQGQVIGSYQYANQPPQMGQPVYAPPPMPPGPLPEGVRPQVDQTMETTQIKITLHTGQSTTLIMNPDVHTVAEIHTYVMSVQPGIMSY